VRRSVASPGSASRYSGAAATIASLVRNSPLRYEMWLCSVLAAVAGGSPDQTMPISRPRH
jgi:hypothetical protein